MATIKDIANKAGVSMMTVSRAFNKPDQVKEELRERIMEISRELDYTPNQAARSLASNKTGIIQLITSLSADNHYFTQLFAGAADYLSGHGYSIMINHYTSLNYQHDGIIFTGLSKKDLEKVSSMTKKPYVVFGKPVSGSDWVDINNEKGVQTVTEYLIDKGHKKIGYVGIKSNELFSDERENGFAKAIKEHGLELSDSMFIRVENLHGEAKKDALKFLGEMDVTAYVCASDQIAFGIVEAAKTLNIKVPEDLSIVGFDGSLYSEVSNPPLTTVKQPVYEIGRVLAKVLLNRIENPKMPTFHELIELDFLERASVADINK